MSEVISYELKDRVAILRFDDGKANALSPAAIEQLNAAFDRAEKEAGSVLLVGREGRFSAGFDLRVMSSGPEPMRALVGSGCKLMARMLTFPRPIVAAATGHALAAGALLLLSSDYRIGADGEFKIGLNEVAIGLKPPLFIVELARLRLSRRHFGRSVTQAEIYTPDGACDAGFLDRLASPEELFGTALAEAERLAPLPSPPFAAGKVRAYGETARLMVDRLEEDMASFESPVAS